LKITFVGATRMVTGSCFYIQSNDTHLLVDCGFFQGSKEDEKRNEEPFPFNPADIQYLLLTHAHLDHSGLIPRLVKKGFRGKILTTKATVELCNMMLLDSAHIQERDAEWENKKRMRAGRPLIQPLYTTDETTNSLAYFQGTAYNETVSLANNLKVRFQDAGHILGSAILELWIKEGAEEKKLVFSGDLGQKDLPIVKNPTSIEEGDYVFVESTYGNRMHKDIGKTTEEFCMAVTESMKNGGNVVIPAFAVGRTQNVLYILNQLSKEGKLKHFRAFVDSPMAVQATAITLNHPECFDEETREIVKGAKFSDSSLSLKFSESVEDSMAINKIKHGAIIISASGMCNAGRIRHHLKHNLWRSECSIIFVGYQAHGTLGRIIIEGAKEVKLLGDDIAVKAKIYTIGGFSAHADQQGLLEWLGAFKKKPRRVFVMHGEEDTALKFAETVKTQLNMDAYAPFCMESMMI